MLFVDFASKGVMDAFLLVWGKNLEIVSCCGGGWLLV